MKQIITTTRRSLSDMRYTKLLAYGAAAVFAGAIAAEPAFAQASEIFDKPINAAEEIGVGISRFAMAIGLIGIVCCLILGFFGKLNWKWLITAAGASFGIAIAGFVMQQMSQLGGGLPA